MKKNSLSMAVVAGIAGVAGLAGVANAVNVNPDGLGQVLLFPYYTVNGGNATLISVVNTTDQAKAVKVRFLESLNSAEVLDFNLYLSEFDVWVASVVETPAGAAIFTEDTSCTVPLGVGKDWVNGTPGVASGFLPFEFQRAAPSGGDVIGRRGLINIGGAEVAISAAERVRQGHIEMIEMGSLFDEGPVSAANFTPESWATHQPSTTQAAATPLNCGALNAAWASNGRWTANNGRAVNAPTGGLFGGALIVDVEFGRALSYNADAIDGFWTPAGLTDVVTAGVAGEADLHTDPGNLLPNLAQARTNAAGNADANLFINGSVVTASFTGGRSGLNAVSASMMARYAMNEYNLNPGLEGASEWVVTFPTKRLHIHNRLASDNRPFTDNTDDDTGAARKDASPFDTFGSCEVYGFARWDREESPIADVISGPIISPPPPSGPGSTAPELCWESNVIAFEQDLDAETPTAVLGATPKQGAHALSGVFTGIDAGWASIEFNDPFNATGEFSNYLVAQNGVALVGLPVIGFWAADYANDRVAAGLRASFNQLHKHRFARGYATGATDPGVGFVLDTAGLAGFGAS